MVKAKAKAKAKTKKPAKRGPKPLLIVTQQLLDEVEVLSGRGLTQQMIHYYYGVSHSYWYNLVKNHPELAEAVKRGKSRTIAMVAGKLIELVKKGNLSAIIFYLKTQARFAEHQTIGISGPGEDGGLDLDESSDDPREAAKIYQKIMLGS